MFQSLPEFNNVKISKKQSVKFYFNQPTCNALRYFQYKYRRSQYFEAKRQGKLIKFPLPVFTIQ